MTHDKRGHGSRKLTRSSFPYSDCCILPVAARRVAGGIYSERYVLIPATTILYAFTGSATALDLITARWTNAQDLQSAHVYIRMSTGVFFVHHRSLATLLKEHLGAAQFLFLHQSLFVNIKKITDLDMKGSRKKVGVSIEDHRGTPQNAPETEWLVVSRRHVPGLRQFLGLPRGARWSARGP